MTRSVFRRTVQPVRQSALPAFRRFTPDTLQGSGGRLIFARSLRNKVLRYLNLRGHSDELFRRFARVDDADWWFRVKPLIEGRMSKGKLAAAILMLGEIEAKLSAPTTSGLQAIGNTRGVAASGVHYD